MTESTPMPDDSAARSPVAGTVADFPANRRSVGPIALELLPVAHLAADPGLAAFVDRGWSGLIAAGHAAADAVAFLDGDVAIVARDRESTPVGILIHRHIARPPRTFIAFGYVDPRHRRNGIYSRLYARLVAEARVAGSAAIESEAYSGNEAILACARGQGRVVSRLILQATL